MNVLYISNKPIYPIVDGGCFAMGQFLDCLLTNKDLNIKHLTIATQKHPFEINAYPKKIIEKAKPEPLNINTKFKPLKALVSLLKNSAYHLERFHDINSQKRVDSIIKSFKPDIIIIETPFLGKYIRNISDSTQTYVRTHNVESNIWKEKSIQEKNIFKKIILTGLANSLQKAEYQLLNKVSGVISISNSDSEFFRLLGVTSKLTTIPPFFEISEQPKSINRSFFFFGAMNWEPNIEASEYIVNIILPKLKIQFPDIILNIGGSFNELNQTSKDPSIHFHGFVKDKNKFLSESGILIAPIFSGSGIKIKVLEALSFGIPVIGSEKAFEGIPVTNGFHAFIAKNQDDFINYSIKLINSPDLRLEIGKKGQQFIQELYNKQIICSQINEFIS